MVEARGVKVTLFSKVLVALDGSLTAEAALGFLPSVMEPRPANEVILFTVVESGAEEDLATAKGYLDRTAADLSEWWKGAEAPVPIIHTRAAPAQHDAPNHPPGKRRISNAIVDTAKAAQADLILLSSNGWAGSDRWLIGLVAEVVLQLAETAVLLVRADDFHRVAPAKISRILAPLDGSELAEQALACAAAVASRTGAREATVAHVRLPKEGAASRIMRPTWDFRPFPRGDEGAYLSEAARRLEEAGMAVTTALREGDPGPQVAAEALEGGADLIVMTSHGRSGSQTRPYGKVADDILHASPAPVLMLHTGE